MQEPLTSPPRGPRRGVASGLTPMVLPGSKSPAKVHQGSPGTWEILPSPSTTTSAQAGRTQQAQARRPARSQGRGGSERVRTRRRYRQAKEDEARRDGRQEVAAP